MPISTGDKLPDATFTQMTAEGPTQMNTSDIFGGRKVVAFAVPGAFTPTCHHKHLPGFIAQADALKAKGADSIVCIAVNDIFVLNAWSENTNAGGDIQFLSDGNAEFTKAIGMDLDASGFGMGTRSLRYAMLVDDGVVKAIHCDEIPSNADESSAEKMLEAL